MSSRSCRDGATVEGVQRLRALADNVADVLAGGEMIRHSDTKHLDGGHAANVRHLWMRVSCGLALVIKP